MLKGKIPDFGYDIKMLSVVVDGEKSKSIPSRGLYKTQINCSNGTRGEWDYNAWNLTLENVNSNSKCNISFTSNLTQEEYDKYIDVGKAMRRNTYRGKDITSYHTDGSLYEMISSGRFDDIYVGDYITANNITWLVADIDNYLYSGRTALTKHHITVIPAVPILDASMNDTNTAEGGYYNSKMKQSTLLNILNTYIKPVFNEHLLSYYTILTTEVSADKTSISFGTTNSGASNSWEWYESQIDLMSEINVYGVNLMSSSILDSGIDNSQYSIFSLKPDFKISYNGTRFRNYWLKNVVNLNTYAIVHSQDFPYYDGAITNYGVRPRFLIG